MHVCFKSYNMKIKDTSRLRNEAQYELTRNILPFWMDKAVDK
jgi:hypothetical protein